MLSPVYTSEFVTVYAPICPLQNENTNHQVLVVDVKFRHAACLLGVSETLNVRGNQATTPYEQFTDG